MLSLDNSLIKSARKINLKNSCNFNSCFDCFLKYLFRAVKVYGNLQVLFHGFIGSFVNDRSITVGLPGFLIHVEFFN